MATTTRGLVYPASSAHTRIWEHFQNLANSADTAIGVVAAAIPADTGWVTSTAGFVALSGQSVTSVAYRKIGNMVSLIVNYTAPAITVGASGNTTNTTVLTVPVALRPAAAGSAQALSNGGSGQMTQYVILSDGSIQIVSTVPNVTITAGSAMTATGTYFL